LSLFLEQLEHWEVLARALPAVADAVDQASQRLVDCLQDGGKVLTCGNGGSACDAMHLAEELVGRFRTDRRALPAICLCADATYLTCAANDFGFDAVFERAVEALARPEDVLVGFSTSGASPNVLRAFDAARRLGAFSIGLLGRDGGPARDRCDLPIIVPELTRMARVQEAHTLILHTWCEAIEQRFGVKATE